MKRSDWFSKSFKVSHCSVINVLCLLSCDSLIILSNRCSFVKHFFYFLNSVLSSLSCDSLFILSKCFSFVKNFFVFFCISVLRQKKAQGVGFEPTRPCGQTVFKTASLWPLRYLSKALSQTCSLIIPHNTIFVKHFSKFFSFFYSFLIVYKICYSHALQSSTSGILMSYIQ